MLASYWSILAILSSHWSGARDVLDEEMSCQEEVASGPQCSQGHAHHEETHIPLCCSWYLDDPVMKIIFLNIFYLSDAENCLRLKTGAAAVTRVTLVSADLASPQDSEEYKQVYWPPIGQY